MIRFYILLPSRYGKDLLGSFNILDSNGNNDL